VYVKNPSEVTNGFSDPLNPISILLCVNTSEFMIIPEVMTPFWNDYPLLSVT
jgi:hypothetical protein